MFMERRRIVELWQSGAAGVLVTLVHAEGSSYRRPGARLLTSLDDAQPYAGTISGGCLEAEVSRKAAWHTRDGAHVERYSMLFDDTAEIPFGLGCGGVVDLLYESAATPEAEALAQALEGSLAGRRATVITFLPSTANPGQTARPLRRLVLDAAGEVVFASPSLSDEKIECARKLQPGQSYPGRFVEQLDPPQRLLVLGAGDDARPLVSMAALLGWSVLVADGRAPLARSARFADAERVITAASAAQIIAELKPGMDDAVILMTHSYEQDREMLTAVLAMSPRYMGLLGSRHRSSLLIAEVAARLDRPVASCCERLFAPVGLNLGGDGPEAIALAILSEVQAVCQGRRTLREPITQAEVERQLTRGGAEQYLHAQCAMDAV